MDMYLFFVVVLFALAISDLMVGVANDAVNFLNSAIGSKVTSRTVILIVASLGIIMGATFSNGMMEVARSGLFHPQHFLFTEVIVLFMAVMFTDVLLLDFFNTFGLPTSTTVSLVFGLLGAAVGITWLKVSGGATIMVDGVETVGKVGDFINSSKALAIISSILLSVVFSFIFGIIVQWVSRLIFSFNFERTLKYYGSLWSGAAISAITYFILIKGLKSASFMTDENYHIFKDNTFSILLAVFLGSTILLQLLLWFFKVNPLKVVVLMGTFALALAFAGNDLVNFIGVPLAGFESFKIFQANGGNDLLMDGLNNPVSTETYILLLAGIIMVATLWFSKKSRTVADTELNLSRQDEGAERFSSSIFARVLVHRVITINGFFSKVIPQSTITNISKRFDQSEYNERMRKVKNPPVFDLVRASVNMVVSAVLIAIGTSYKLPLSTTYVTFMVAMSTSLVDGAWGRDSAVYRITGVFSVIGGWFMTAIFAFTIALLIAIFISWSKLIGVILLVAFAIFAIVRTNSTHKKREEKKNGKDENEIIDTAEKVLSKCNQSLNNSLNTTLSVFSQTMVSLIAENRKELRLQWQIIQDLNTKVKQQKDKVHKTISKLQQDSIESGHYYVQVIDYQREMTLSLAFIVEPILKHVENRHKTILPVQAEELNKLAGGVSVFANRLLAIIAEGNYDELEGAIESQNVLLEAINSYRKAQIKRIKNQEVGTKNSMLYMNILSETKNMLLYGLNMVKAQRDFVMQTKGLK